MSSLLRIAKLYLFTLRYLTITQIFFQLYYRVKRLLGNKIDYIDEDLAECYPLTLIPSLSSKDSLIGSNHFIFLNKKKEFGETIDWNYLDYGKLWAYNLNYFDFLHQDGLDDEGATSLLDRYCDDKIRLKMGVDPYPISLRGINWIKYFANKNISKPVYNAVLKSHYIHLCKNLEYHLLGNHLLENGFSLFFGSYYFRDEKMYSLSVKILRRELSEQILDDGGHFELSPMYHQILLFRLLDCINLCRHNNWKDERSIVEVMEEKAAKMIGWIKAMSFSNGDIPMVNDSAYGIAPTTDSLINYAERLGISSNDLKLSDSGYRMIRNSCFELLIDVGQIAPDYIPGHAHSDTFNFILYAHGKPIIVDTGTSTYDVCECRMQERSTQSHNTVQLNGLNQSEIWSAFRVGKRARIIDLVEGNNSVESAHNGYHGLGVIHRRKWGWDQNEITIRDELITGNQKYKATAFIHFHPDIVPDLSSASVDLKGTKIFFEGSFTLEKFIYEYALGFNSRTKALGVKIEFYNNLFTKIILQQELP